MSRDTSRRSVVALGRVRFLRCFHTHRATLRKVCQVEHPSRRPSVRQQVGHTARPYLSAERLRKTQELPPVSAVTDRQTASRLEPCG